MSFIIKTCNFNYTLNLLSFTTKYSDSFSPFKETGSWFLLLITVCLWHSEEYCFDLKPPLILVDSCKLWFSKNMFVSHREQTHTVNKITNKHWGQWVASKLRHKQWFQPLIAEVVLNHISSVARIIRKSLLSFSDFVSKTTLVLFFFFFCFMWTMRSLCACFGV